MEKRILLNVGGLRYETTKSILKKIPATRLSRLTEALANYDPITCEYFFDRHPGVFAQILNYYYTGRLHYPSNVCGPLFEEELEFWGLDMNEVEPCCYKKYYQHRCTEETLEKLDRLNIDNMNQMSRKDLLIKFNVETNYFGRIPLFNRLQPFLWQLLEEPKSSKAAMVYDFIQILMIILSVCVLWFYSCSSQVYKLVEMKGETNDFSTNYKKSIFLRINDDKIVRNLKYIDYITISWFSFDFVLRFLVSPSKIDFMKKFDNIIDFISTFFAYIDFIFINCNLRKLEVIRVVRLLRLFSLNPGLKIIIASLKASAFILNLIVIVIIITSIIFGSFVYYLEKLTIENEENNKFESIIDGLWFTILSLTTTGYGDLAPVTAMGRLIGSCSVITGVLMVGLPITIIVQIFKIYNAHSRARSKLPLQRRRIQPVEPIRRNKKMTHL